MRTLILFVVMLLATVTVYSQGIVFQEASLEEALVLAEKENKLVFVDCYTQWCGPCKLLSKDVFPQKNIGDLFNNRFISLKVDMETEEGDIIAKRYKVKAYPTLLWLNAKGILQHKIQGAGSAESLILSAKEALDTENSWNALNERFKKGDRDLEFLQKYIISSAKAGIKVKEAQVYYFQNKRHEELINVVDIELITRVVKSTSDPVYQFVLKNKIKFYSISSNKQIDGYLEGIMYSELGAAKRKGDDVYEAKKRELIALDDYVGTKAGAFLDMQYSIVNQDKSIHYHAKADYDLKYCFDDAELLKKDAWDLALAIKHHNDELINKIFKMTKRSLELDGDFTNHNTYAFLLLINGNVDEAKQFAEKAVELAPQEEKKSIWSYRFINGGN